MGFSFRDAAKTKGGGNGRKPFIEAGIEAELMCSLAKLIEKGFKGTSYVFEFKVMSAKAIENGVTAPPPGAERVYIVNLDDPKYGLANLMSVAEAMNGGDGMPGLSDAQVKEMKDAGKTDKAIEDADLDKKEAALSQLLGEAQGVLIRVSTRGVKTAKGEDFTAIDWKPVAGQTIESVRANRATI